MSSRFRHEDQAEIYDYVRTHGPVDREEVEQAIFPHEPRGFRQHLEFLKYDHHLRESAGGRLEVGLDFEGEEEQFETDGVTYAIRPAHQTDFAEIAEAIRRTADERPHTIPGTIAEELERQNVLLRADRIESRVFFIATVGDEVVGWVYVGHPELEQLSHTAELLVGVAEEYRGMGIGANLLRRGLDWTESKGCEKVYQSLPATNEGAIEFLKRLGWEIEAVRENHYKIGEEYVDEMMMSIAP